MPLPLAAIPGGIQGVLGIGQLIGGSLMRVKRPEYEIPKAAQEDLAMSRMGLNGRMPGINYASARLDQNAANSQYRLQRGATNSSQLLSGLAGIQMNSNIAARGLMEAEAGDYIRRESNLRRSLGVMANYQNRKWELDKFQPYQDKARTKAALIGSGLQNISGGIGQAIGGVVGERNLEKDRQAMLEASMNGQQPDGQPQKQAVPFWMQMMSQFRNGFMGIKPEEYNRDIYG